MNNKEVYCEEVIIAKNSTRGKGDQLSPIRRIVQVFDKGGELIAEYDPSPETYTVFDLVYFANYCLNNDVHTPTPKIVNDWLESIKKNNP